MPLPAPSHSPENPQAARLSEQPGSLQEVPAREDFRVAYCTNVHPGVDLESVLQNLSTRSARVACRFDGKVGAGAWFSDQAAQELLSSGRLQDLISLCQNSRLSIETLNGFPFGNFHQEVVKHEVYQPDWAKRERLDYTLRLSKIAAALCRPGDSFGISTLPLGWRGSRRNLRNPSDLDLTHCAHQLAQVAFQLWEQKQDLGVELHLDLEPEPGCWLETSEDTVHFFQEFLLSEGLTHLTRVFGLKKSDAETLLRAHLQICYDTCHAAVAFEEPRAVLRNYEREGLKIGKVQMSSALVVADAHQKEVRSALAAFAQDRYLHQVIGRLEGHGDVFFQDLPEALEAWENGTADQEFRIHCHVPIHLSEVRVDERTRFATTQPHLIELIQLHRLKPITTTWEVETYTWGVLPKTLQLHPHSDFDQESIQNPSGLQEGASAPELLDSRGDLLEKLCLEMDWALKQLEGKTA